MLRKSRHLHDREVFHGLMLHSVIEGLQSMYGPPQSSNIHEAAAIAHCPTCSTRKSSSAVCSVVKQPTASVLLPGLCFVLRRAEAEKQFLSKAKRIHCRNLET